MKKSTFVIVLICALVSCKKESTNTNSTTNTSNGVACLDNPNINYTSIGTPIGKFSDCIKDIDGNVYKTVIIGTQTWMAENLKTSKYNDGTIIPNLTDNTKWNMDTIGAWCYYNNDEKNNVTYGKLYNWYIVNPENKKNVCPIGWHIPNNEEWLNVQNLLGYDLCGYKMKEIGTTHWFSKNELTTNISLFTALPSGDRDTSGNFENFGSIGCFYSSTSKNVYPVSYKALIFDRSDCPTSVSKLKNYGFSIRCVKN